jgi:inner membrane protein
MDSVTHLALGAALGDAVLGKKIGTRAMLWGAIAGSLPDVDVLLHPFEDDLSFLIHHRGLSHSIFLALIVAPLLGWVMARWYRNEPSKTTLWNWIALFFAGIGSHLLLDACTAYGTPLFMPFSDYRVAINNLFVIDPLFTLPLVVCGIVSVFLGRAALKRRIVNRAGLGLSFCYLTVTLIAGYWVEGVFAASLSEQRIETRRLMAAPTPFNSVLWYCIAEGQDGYYVSYYSVFDDHRPVRFHFVPRNRELLGDMETSRVIERLVWFSNGYYSVRRQEDCVVFDVLKFGMLTPEAGEKPVAFSFVLRQGANGAVSVSNVARPEDVRLGKLLMALWLRIRGGEPSLSSLANPVATYSHSSRCSATNSSSARCGYIR